MTDALQWLVIVLELVALACVVVIPFAKRGAGTQSKRQRTLSWVLVWFVTLIFVAALPVGICLCFNGRVIDGAILAIAAIPFAAFARFVFGRNMIY